MRENDNKSVPNVTIDGDQYELASLPEEVHKELAMIIHIDHKLKELQQSYSVMLTSRNAYVARIKTTLAQSSLMSFKNELADLDALLNKKIDFSMIDLKSLFQKK